MSVQIPKKPKDLDDVHKTQVEFYDNFGIGDLKPGEVLTAVPTTDDLDIGRHTIREISSIPKHYYRGTNGTIYLLSTGVAI